MTAAAVDAGFRPIAPGRVHRWGGARLIVARAGELRQVPPLSPAERRLVRGMRAWRQAEWTAGRLLAKRLLGEVVSAPAEGVEILPRDDGSPRVVVGGTPAHALYVSISHTAGHVAAALAPVPVGVDLCERDSADAVRRVADHFLSPEELSLVGRERPDAMTGAWALKEAAVKADRSSVFGAAPRGIPILGIRPPLLGGRRRAMVWRADDAALALVLAHPGG
ncbi:4'-phosphopantetheinyl transferase family protein [Streptomyces xanthophaeus]|uniref:4'-phosphopantetheinyl transferase family protein n=1 Tax=Streptomyces xanthophaeus TaxID=67385 RepID=UPI0026485A6A|nr:4'-phosphopantetheinyl transferase superfamily protein [Streptomyces xanthophaeus]WKD35954.1 4'-phosphopantetheinyl transferase superfamily protein [Streptomyces xanthophaeus]